MRVQPGGTRHSLSPMPMCIFGGARSAAGPVWCTGMGYSRYIGVYLLFEGTGDVRMRSTLPLLYQYRSIVDLTTIQA